MAAGNISSFNWHGYLECAAVQSQPGAFLKQEIIFHNPTRKTTGKGTQLEVGKRLQDQGVMSHATVVLTKNTYFLSHPHQGEVTFSPLKLCWFQIGIWLLFFCNHEVLLMARVNLCLYPSGCNYGILYALHIMYILCTELLPWLLLRLSWCFTLKLGLFFVFFFFPRGF